MRPRDVARPKASNVWRREIACCNGLWAHLHEAPGSTRRPGSVRIAGQSIRSAWRDRQARRIQKRVMRELEELERLNRAAEEEAK